MNGGSIEVLDTQTSTGLVTLYAVALCHGSSWAWSFNVEWAVRLG